MALFTGFGARRGRLSGHYSGTSHFARMRRNRPVAGRLGQLGSGRIGPTPRGGGTRVTFDWFFDRPQVQSRLKKGERKALSEVGAMTRRIAKNSLRLGPRIKAKELVAENENAVGYRNLAPGQADAIKQERDTKRQARRRIRSLEQQYGGSGRMPSASMQRYYNSLQRRVAFGGSRVYAPRKTSLPNQVPHLTHSKSPLKKLIYFKYDPRTRSVVIGPEPYSTLDAKTIERGGRSKKSGSWMHQRPFMRLALKAGRRNYPRIFLNAANRAR